MTQTTSAPRRPPKAVYKVLNPAFDLVLRSPLHNVLSERLMSLIFTGRKSGKQYITPVGYVQASENTLLVATESAWHKNFIGGALVAVRLRGQRRTGQATLLSDDAEVNAALRTMVTSAPQLGQIMQIGLDADGQPKMEDIAAARERGFVVVRVTLN